MIPVIHNKIIDQPVENVPADESSKPTLQPSNPQNQLSIKPYSEQLWMKEQLEKITEIDVVFESKKELRKLQKQYPQEITVFFTKELMSVIGAIKPAQEILIEENEILSNLKKAVKWRLKPESSLFSNIRKILQDIKTLNVRVAAVEKALEDKNFLNELKEVLTKLRCYYEQFISECCEANESEFEQLKAFKPYIIFSSSLERRYLKKRASKELLAAISSKRPDGQNHIVVPYAAIHFKGSPDLLPDAPGTEFMVHAMANILFGRGTPPTELLKIVHSNHKEGNSRYPVIASKTKYGVNLREFEERETLESLHPTGYAESFFLGLFTNPNDGKPENFIVDNEGWIWGIDMDRSEVCPYIKVPFDDKPYRYRTNIFYYPFLFPQMDHQIDTAAKQSFLSFHPALNMIKWLKKLLDQNAKYNQLQKSGLFFSAELKAMHLPIQIFEGLVQAKYQKMLTTWQLLTNDQEGALTYRELFELVDPITAKYYEVIQKKHLTPLEGYQNAYYLQNWNKGPGANPQEIDQFCWIDSMLDLHELVNEGNSIEGYLTEHAVPANKEESSAKQKEVIDELENLISTIDCRSLGAYEREFLTEIGKVKQLRTLSLKNSTICDDKLLELVDSLPALTHIKLNQCPNIPGLCLITIAKYKPKLKFYIADCAQVKKIDLEKMEELGQEVVTPSSLNLHKQEECQKTVNNNLPAKNPLFTGRKAHLLAINNRFDSLPGPVVLTGMGGVGKSHLALEFAHQNKRNYDLVWWICAEKKKVCLDTVLLLGENLEKITKKAVSRPRQRSKS